MMTLKSYILDVIFYVINPSVSYNIPQMQHYYICLAFERVLKI
jgi:hypothetical protein